MILDSSIKKSAHIIDGNYLSTYIYIEIFTQDILMYTFINQNEIRCAYVYTLSIIKVWSILFKIIIFVPSI